jgi:hypothetical protein
MAHETKIWDIIGCTRCAVFVCVGLHCFCRVWWILRLWRYLAWAGSLKSIATPAIDNPNPEKAHGRQDYYSRIKMGRFAPNYVKLLLKKSSHILWRWITSTGPKKQKRAVSYKYLSHYLSSQLLSWLRSRLHHDSLPKAADYISEGLHKSLRMHNTMPFFFTLILS